MDTYVLKFFPEIKKYKVNRLGYTIEDFSYTLPNLHQHSFEFFVKRSVVCYTEYSVFIFFIHLNKQKYKKFLENDIKNR